MNRNQLLGICGALLLLIGTFLPIVSAPVVGRVNYFGDGRGDGIFILIFVVLAAFFIYRKRYRWLLLPGFGSLVWLIYGYLNLNRMIGEVSSRMNAGLAHLADSPAKESVAGMANAAVDSIQLQWGWVVLLLGALLLIAAGLLKPGVRTDSITEAIKLLDPSVLKKLPFSRKKQLKGQKQSVTETAFTAPIQSDDVCEICSEGRKHLVSGSLEQALAAFSKAIDQDPTNRSAYYHRGLVYQKLGQKRLARGDFQAAAELGHRTAQGIVASKKFFS